MSAAPPLLSAAVRQLSRSAYGVAITPARGFQVFRIDGYSWTKSLPPGECLSSAGFTVGGRNWHVDYYPNGTDGATDSDSDAITVHLRAAAGYQRERVRAQYRFSLLDPAGDAAYELPAATAIFTAPVHNYHRHDDDDEEAAAEVGIGIAGFITKDELERRRETLLRDDCLAIRCDVGVTEQGVVAVAPKESHHDARKRYGGGGDDDDSDWEDGGRESGRRRRQPPLDDMEYIRRCLAKNRVRSPEYISARK